MKTKQTCISGDPHFRTFDGLHFDYQGTCPFIFSQPCTQLDAPFVYFSVRAANAFIGSSRSVSGVSEVEVDMYNLTIHVDGRTSRFIVNGIEQHVPYYWPSKDRQIVTVKYSSGVFYITNDQMVQVIYYVSGNLCVQVPDIPQFQGQQKLCGIGGNLDGNYKNDVVDRNSTVFQIKRNPVTYNEAFNRVEDTWITSNFIKIRPNAPACVTGEQVSNLTNCDSQAAATICDPIKQAMYHNGPFSDCYLLGNDTIETAYDNCVFDVCHAPDQKCNVLQTFAKNCRYVVPGGDIGDWRPGTACPPPTCPIHSHYETCKSSCPASCADSSAPDFCDQPCSEGCICDPGYVLDNTRISTLTCIPIDQCGCTDSNGNSHPANTPFITSNCDIRSWCVNGTLYSERYGCDPHAVCSVSGEKMACVCLPGFTGNGTTCVDIDECLDPTSCNADKGHGNCTNTIGSYHCDCAQFFTQPHCQNYQPRRHCADLRRYWDIADDGVYTINPPYTFAGSGSFGEAVVYCDMNTDGGGWTLMSSDRSSGMANRTYQNYIEGFGTPSEQQVWLGLDLIKGMTNYENTSLRLNLYRCPHNGLTERHTYCTYKNFLVRGAVDDYAVVIPEVCQGTEEDFYDGWARWNLDATGPSFIAFDNDYSDTNCSATFRNTGWWYDTRYRCGAANLNGIRYSCDNVPEDSTSSTYLFWAGSPLGQAWLYLRPTLYPDYDPMPPMSMDLAQTEINSDGTTS
ncbi:hypothetical protein ANCCAN_02392 [Ancylostoma caninum]|uniref:EGF-like domain protein n=1 Tax=Ancylostoma caninum TaxID=29170 RepID=A0A368H4A7_ANCCA|nr:hypothetical protein ANCCAN_02392 [Ancylostoma caninum]